MKRFIHTLVLLTAFASTSLAGDSTQVLKRIDQLEGSYAAKSGIKIGLFEESVKGWATYADAAGPTPVNGTGGAPTVTFTRTTGTPLEGKASAVLTKDAANRQGEGASYDFSLDAAYTGTIPQNMVIEFYYSTGGTFVSGAASDVQVYVYDVTASALITPTTTAIGSSPGRFQSSFLPVSGSSDYRLIFHVATTSAAAWTLKVDKISIHETPTAFNTSGVSSVATLTEGNGFGSTNTNIRRYTNISTQGTALTCADSATLGTSCTVNQDGLYTANRIDRNTGAAANFGIVKNDDCTAGGFNSVASSNQIAYTMAASNVAVNAADAGTAMSSGDVIRACDDSAAKTNDTTDRTSRLVIAKVRDEALPTAFISSLCTGGTQVTDPSDANYKICTYTASGTFTIASGSGTVESLVVGGGGGGGDNVGTNIGAGGGGGGVIYTTPGATYGAGAYTITVGAGGAANAVGGTSTFDVISAGGGGDGGQYDGVSGTAGAAINGNGGGGGGASAVAGTGGAGNGAGFAGGNGAVNVTFAPTGGGGGAGGAGGNATGPSTAGNGGVGLANSITGASVTYAGGGGGGVSGGTAGTGGTGGGGNGSATVGGANGTANTGGGGGGSGSTGVGGTGGSGVVILRYRFQ